MLTISNHIGQTSPVNVVVLRKSNTYILSIYTVDNIEKYGFSCLNFGIVCSYAHAFLLKSLLKITVAFC